MTNLCFQKRKPVHFKSVEHLTVTFVNVLGVRYQIDDFSWRDLTVTKLLFLFHGVKMSQRMISLHHWMLMFFVFLFERKAARRETHRFRLQIHLPSSSKSLAVFTCADMDVTFANIHTNLRGRSVTFICLYNLKQDFHTKLLKFNGLCAVKKNNSINVLKYQQTAFNLMLKNTQQQKSCVFRYY